MSIVSVNERALNRPGDKDISGRRYLREFLVETDSVTDGPAQVLAASGLPAIYSQYPSDTASILKRLEPDPYEDRLHWIVRCRYEPRNADEPRQDAEEPWELPPDISFGSAAYNKPVAYAYQKGTADTSFDWTQQDPAAPYAVQNSAEKPFDPPLMQNEDNMVIVISRNEQAYTTGGFDPEVLNTYKQTVNGTKITIAGKQIDAFQGLMRECGAQKMWSASGKAYYRVTYEIEVATRAMIDFNRRVVDEGFSTMAESSSGTKTWTRIMDDGTPPRPMVEPSRLDGAGQRSYSDRPTVLKFQTRLAIPWDNLALPTSR